jgi:hypothetical protein
MINYKDGYINRTGLHYDNISSKTNIEYNLPNNKLIIEKPLYLNLDVKGVHRHITKDDWCYYIKMKTGFVVKFNKNKIPV